MLGMFDGVHCRFYLFHQLSVDVMISPTHHHLHICVAEGVMMRYGDGTCQEIIDAPNDIGSVSSNNNMKLQ